MVFLIILLLLFAIIKISAMISKTVAVLIDFIFLGFFTAISLHGAISVKIASGKAIYFWDTLFFITACVLYFIALNLLVIYFPRIAKFLNYMVAWIGTFIIYIVLSSLFTGDALPQLLNNDSLSQFTNLIIISIIAFATYNVRKKIFANTDEESNIVERNEENYVS
ncbi:hypothetical protein [Lysinibacillus sp. Bpr_S20]|uniref:hypothetical protein n=1 Tax=Lysinibacillus sp. Bpr_S20 TaxID=2933964 RepID=UPI002013A46F|nr:hypothetical protein [Lysinibacillus sp. Bpr_S20]MCL1702156.1 hypothetical protein [Lysinibacillus sp. Bpr_S20]